MADRSARLAADPIFVELVVKNNAKVQLVSNSAGQIAGGMGWNPPHDQIKEARAFRKNEQGKRENACLVVRTDHSTDAVIDTENNLQLPVPLIFVPVQWKANTNEIIWPEQVEGARFDLFLQGKAYAGNLVRLEHWQAECVKIFLGQAQRAGNNDTTLEEFTKDSYQAFRIANGKDQGRPPYDVAFFAEGTPLSGIIVALNNRKLVHSGESDGVLVKGEGIDVVTRPLAVEDRTLIALGFGLAIGNPDNSTKAASIELRIGPERVELPVDEKVRLRTFQSPRTIESALGATEVDWIVELADLPARAFGVFWNSQVARPHYAALGTVDGARDLSLLPFFEKITPSAGEGRFTLAWRIRHNDVHSLKFAAFDAAQFIGAYPSAKGNSFKADAKFPQLKGRREEQTYQRRVEVEIASEPVFDGLYADLAAADLSAVRKLTLEVRGDGTTPNPADDLQVRVGGLDLTLNPALAIEGSIDLSFETLRIPLPVRVPHVSVDFARFGLANVAPGGQDPTPDELLARNVLSDDERRAVVAPDQAKSEDLALLEDVARAAPIIAAPGRLISEAGELILQAEETTATDRSRNMVLRLRFKPTTSMSADQTKRRARDARGASDVRAADAPKGLQAVIVDTEPFQVAKVTLPSVLDQLAFGDDVDGEFAIYRISEREGQGWSLSGLAQGFDLYLPPQGVGEAMEKGAPWPDIGKDGACKHATIDYRLSPAARFWLQDREVTRRFAEAPWNLRRRFGDAGQRDPGTEFAGLRAELLYGLAMHLRGDNLRLSELGALIGAPRENLTPIEVGRNATDPAKARAAIHKQFRQRWANLRKVYGTRLAVLEPRRSGTQGRFVAEQDLDYLLRIAGKIRADATPADLREPLNTSPDALGLPGGATWGFESNNVYQETIENPRSTGGRVSNLAFTALGGSGSFTAEFAKGKTRIGAEVAIGRTHRYVVERLGRIGLLWNHAKHVIVYERTVLPSEQFSDPDIWDRSKGRPILRKVKEYVELLQPVRKFAEVDAPAIRRAGAEAAVFKTIKIPVDGRNWGRDIPEGWTVPLWRPDADQRLYPKPQIAVRMTATKESAEPSVDADATEPHRMVFFTSTRREDGADTDRWAPVLGTDFVNAVRPQSLFSAAEPTDDQQADDLIEDPLYAAVTIPISTAGRQVSLGEGRVADGLGAALESLTFMRAAPAIVPKAPSAQQAQQEAAFNKVADARRILAEAQRVLDTIPSRLERLARGTISAKAEWKEELKTAIRREAVDMESAIKAAADRARKSIAGLDASAAWIQPGVEAVKVESRRLRDRGENIIREVREAVDRAQREGDKAIDAAEADWNNKKITVVQEIGSLLLAAHALIRSPWPALVDVLQLEKDFAAFAERLRNTVKAEIERLEKRAADVTLDNDITKARRLARELTFQFERKAGDLIDQAAEAIQKVPPRFRVISEARFNQLRAAVDDSAKTARLKIAEAPDNAKIRERLQKMVADLKAAVGDIESVIDLIRAALTDAVNAAKKEVKKVSTVLDDLNVWVASIESEINVRLKTIGEAADATAAVTELKGATDKIREILAGVDQGLRKASDAIINNFVEVVGDLLGGVNGGFDTTKQKITSQIDAFEKAGVAAVAAARDWALSLVDELDQNLKPLEEALQAIGGRAAAFAREALGITQDLERGMAESVGRLATVPTFQNPESTLNLIRAAGQSPLVPNFKFNRDRVAYIFDDFAEAVRTSPMVGLVNRAGDDLKALGLRVPTDKLAERILPAELQNFDIGKIFPDLAGFKLDGLFRGIKLPRIAQDNIKVTHGFDRASQTAWAKASSDIPLGAPSDILSFGPLRLTLSGGRFTALADIVASVQGPPRTKANAEIVADWQLAFGGVTLVTFERTRVAFDDTSGLTVDISPDRIRFDRAVQFLSDLIKSFSDPDSGFVLELEVDSNNRPIGVRAGLDLPLPPLAAGAFAASGIRVAASTALTVSERTDSEGKKQANVFAVECAASIGRPDEPFTLMVAFLNGGGYLTARALYLPQFNRLEARVAVGIVAGVGVDFAFGPARGSVYLQFGAEGAFITPGSGLSLEAFLLIRGGVTVLNLITIGLVMRLGITYQAGSVDARGYLRVEIKISRFFKHRVQVNVHYHLAGKKQSAFISLVDETSHYLDLFA